MPLSTSLTNYWKLDEASGDATDQVGSKTLTNINTVAYGGGLINNGAGTSSSETHNKTLHNATLGIDLSGNASISFWIKPLTVPTVANNRSIDWRSATGTSRYMIIGYELSGGNLRIKVDASGTTIAYNVDLGTTSFSHIVVTYASGGNVVVYLNGLQVTTGTRGTTTASASFDVGNGVEQLSGQAARIDEVGVWSKTLDPLEVWFLYNNGAGNAYPLTSSTSLPITSGSYTYAGQTIHVLMSIVQTTIAYALSFQSLRTGWSKTTKNVPSWTKTSKS